MYLVELFVKQHRLNMEVLLQRWNYQLQNFRSFNAQECTEKLKNFTLVTFNTITHITQNHILQIS